MEAPLGVDLRPKLILSGLTIPGKKMMKVLMPEGTPGKRSSELLNLYKDSADVVFMAVAGALHETPQRGTFGPAARAVAKEITVTTVYGATLTDIRDFLKLRFRAKGLPESQLSDDARIKQAGKEKDIAYLINLLIGSLDLLSRQEIGSRDVFVAAVHFHRDLATRISKLASPYGPEGWERGLGKEEDLWTGPG